MNKLILAIPLLFLSLVFAAIPTTAAAAEWQTWVVYQTDIPIDDDLILTGDGFRLKVSGSKTKLKPLRNLANRWGQTGNPNYEAELDKKASNLFCGTFEMKKKGHKIEHNFSISIHSDTYVVLDFYAGDADDACTFKPSHGGLAHAER